MNGKATMTRISHAMHLALEAVSHGSKPKEAATLHGVSLNGLYRAMRRNAPKCPVCGQCWRGAGVQLDSMVE